MRNSLSRGAVWSESEDQAGSGLESVEAVCASGLSHIGYGSVARALIKSETMASYSAALIRSATERVRPGVAAISSIAASRMPRTEPNLRSSARFRAGPTPDLVEHRARGLLAA